MLTMIVVIINPSVIFNLRVIILGPVPEKVITISGLGGGWWFMEMKLRDCHEGGGIDWVVMTLVLDAEGKFLTFCDTIPR